VLRRTAPQAPWAQVLETAVVKEAKDPVCLVNSPPGKHWREKHIREPNPFPQDKACYHHHPQGAELHIPGGTRSSVAGHPCLARARPSRQLPRPGNAQTAPGTTSQRILEAKDSLTTQTCFPSLSLAAIRQLSSFSRQAPLFPPTHPHLPWPRRVLCDQTLHSFPPSLPPSPREPLLRGAECICI